MAELHETMQYLDEIEEDIYDKTSFSGARVKDAEQAQRRSRMLAAVALPSRAAVASTLAGPTDAGSLRTAGIQSGRQRCPWRRSGQQRFASYITLQRVSAKAIERSTRDDSERPADNEHIFQRCARIRKVITRAITTMTPKITRTASCTLLGLLVTTYRPASHEAVPSF